jgi:hypothetical protein
MTPNTSPVTISGIRKKNSTSSAKRRQNGVLTPNPYFNVVDSELPFLFFDLAFEEEERLGTLDNPIAEKVALHFESLYKYRENSDAYPIDFSGELASSLDDLRQSQGYNLNLYSFVGRLSMLQFAFVDLRSPLVRSQLEEGLQCFLLTIDRLSNAEDFTIDYRKAMIDHCARTVFLQVFLELGESMVDMTIDDPRIAEKFYSLVDIRLEKVLRSLGNAYILSPHQDTSSHPQGSPQRV